MYKEWHVARNMPPGLHLFSERKAINFKTRSSQRIVGGRWGKVTSLTQMLRELAGDNSDEAISVHWVTSDDEEKRSHT